MAANYSIRLTTIGSVSNFQIRKVGKVLCDFSDTDQISFEENILVLKKESDLKKFKNINKFHAIILEENSSLNLENLISGFNSGVSHLNNNDIITIDPRSKLVRTIYRPQSKNNTIFTTERCNSNCLMCSQPPKDIDDSYMVNDIVKMLGLIDEPPETLGITGGEPLILKQDLIKILKLIKEKFPSTYVHMLSNGRYLAYKDIAEEIGNIGNKKFMIAIPLYADVPEVHDYIVQAKNAFDQTINGIYNANKNNISIEIRIVLHKQSIPRLTKLADYIISNFPFVKHVALMGLENMGYVKKNWNDLWIDPLDYSKELTETIKKLHYNLFHVSIYNLQLCLINKDLWTFSRQSISDYKNIYLDECKNCDVKKYCSGLFSSSILRHSKNINAQKI